MIACSDCIVVVEANAEAEAEILLRSTLISAEDAKAFEVEVRMDIPAEDTEIGNVINLITREREI